MFNIKKEINRKMEDDKPAQKLHKAGDKGMGYFFNHRSDQDQDEIALVTTNEITFLPDTPHNREVCNLRVRNFEKISSEFTMSFVEESLPGIAILLGVAAVQLVRASLDISAHSFPINEALAGLTLIPAAFFHRYVLFTQENLKLKKWINQNLGVVNEAITKEKEEDPAFSQKFKTTALILEYQKEIPIGEGQISLLPEKEIQKIYQKANKHPAGAK